MSSERRAFLWPATTHVIGAENCAGGDGCNNSNAADCPFDSSAANNNSAQKPSTPGGDDSKNHDHTPHFLPVQVVPEPLKPNAATIDIVLDGGRCLRVAPGFDPHTLRQLLHLLEDKAPC